MNFILLDKEFSSLLAQVEALLQEKLPIPEDEEVEVDGVRVSPAEEALSINPASNQGVVVTFFIWTVKALAMRGYPALDIWIQNKVSMVTLFKEVNWERYWIDS